jgi:hypothetical protein
MYRTGVDLGSRAVLSWRLSNTMDASCLASRFSTPIRAASSPPWTSPACYSSVAHRPAVNRRSLWRHDKKEKERILLTKNHPPLVLMMGSASEIAGKAEPFVFGGSENSL